MNLTKYNRNLPRRGGFLKRGAAAVTAVVGAVASAAASATATLSSGFQTEVTAVKPELMVIGGIVLGICAIVFIIAKARRTSGG